MIYGASACRALAGVAIGTMLHLALCPALTALIERMVTGARLTLRWFVTSLLALAGWTALVLDSHATVGPHLLVRVAACCGTAPGLAPAWWLCPAGWVVTPSADTNLQPTSTVPSPPDTHGQ